MSIDLPEILAAEIRDALGAGFATLTPERVFSDVAPIRRYDGVATLEIAELERRDAPDVDDGDDYETRLAVLARAPTKEQARAIQRGVRKVVAATLDRLEARNEIAYWSKETSVLYADTEQGVPTGSFVAEVVVLVGVESNGPCN